MLFGSRRVKTPLSRSSALLRSVTLLDHRLLGRRDEGITITTDQAV